MPRKRRRVAALLGLASVLLLAAAPAHAADKIYWSNMDAKVISWANLNGSGGGDLPIDPSLMDDPMGLALDSSTGKIYWTNYGGGSGTSIGVANIDGSNAHLLPVSGAPIMGPHGIAVDSKAGKIYWTNYDTPSATSWIGVANLDGSNGAILNTGSAPLNGPRGLAIDPGAGKLYWANWIGNQISVANLDGSGGQQLNTGAATIYSPEGVALSPSQNRLYWGNFTFDDSVPHETISYLNLDGSGGADLPTGSATRLQPHGVAIDPTTGTIYWPNFNAGVISHAQLDGSGGADLPTAPATTDTPNLPFLLKGPAAAGAPNVSGAAAPGSTLHCSQGAWAPDMTASLMYRAPQNFSFQWNQGSSQLPGATSTSLKAAAIDDYTCTVTATNAAGSAVQTSRTFGVFKIGKPKFNRRKGTAKLVVWAPHGGRLDLLGKGVKAQRPASASALQGSGGIGRIQLLVKPVGKARKHLIRTGRAKVKVHVDYAPIGGTKTTQTRPITLKERRRR